MTQILKLFYRLTEVFSAAIIFVVIVDETLPAAEKEWRQDVQYFIDSELDPAKNILNIKTDAKIESVEIFSVSGQRVKSLGSVNPINITDLSKGNYIVVISQNGKKESYKFIKE